MFEMKELTVKQLQEYCRENGCTVYVSIDGEIINSKAGDPAVFDKHSVETLTELVLGHIAEPRKKVKSMSELYPAYYKSVKHLDELDVYMVHQLFNVDDPSGCIQHASKKLLLSGVRTGGKDAMKDIREARDTLTRYLQIHGVE